MKMVFETLWGIEITLVFTLFRPLTIKKGYQIAHMAQIPQTSKITSYTKITKITQVTKFT